jgi:hypothetical protein
MIYTKIIYFQDILKKNNIKKIYKNKNIKLNINNLPKLKLYPIRFFTNEKVISFRNNKITKQRLIHNNTKNHNLRYVYFFIYKKIKYIFKHIIKRNNYEPNESNINLLINKSVDNGDLSINFSTYEYNIILKNDNQILIYKASKYNIWNILDNGNSNKIKSLLLQILASLINLNYKLNLFHSDLYIFTKSGKQLLTNMMYDDINIKNIEYKFNNKIIKIKTHGIITKIIDYGEMVNRKQINDKYQYHLFNFFHKKSFSKYNLDSEIFIIIYCVLNYYRFNNVEKKLIFFIKMFMKKYKFKKINKKFYITLIDYLNDDNNFCNFMLLFTDKWPFIKY